MILLGNLSVEDIEKRAGVKFSDELVEYMTPRRQQNADNVKEGFWHCFDLPFNLVCGDIETATEIHNHLKSFSEDFKEPLQISINKKS